jgi:hypothetical protein
MMGRIDHRYPQSIVAMALGCLLMPQQQAFWNLQRRRPRRLRGAMQQFTT